MEQKSTTGCFCNHIKEITRIRNDSAHKMEPITYERFSQFINILFKGDFVKAFSTPIKPPSFNSRDIIVGNPDLNLGEMLLICKLGGINLEALDL